MTDGFFLGSQTVPSVIFSGGPSSVFIPDVFVNVGRKRTQINGHISAENRGHAVSAKK